MEFIQDILVVSALIGAIVYLVKRFFVKPKKKDTGCNTDCNC